MNNRIIGLFLCIVTCMFSAPIHAQTTDLARIEYLNVPSSSGDNTVQRFRALLQIPIPLDKDRNKIILIGFDYRQLELEFEDNLPFDPSPFETTRRIEATAGYVWKQPETNWRFGFKGGARIVSNLQRSLVSDDVHWLASAYAINDMRKAENPRPYRWIFGLLYTTALGRWYPLPLINYHRDINENWNYTLGVPKTNIRYTFADQKNALQLFAEIDHFFSNIQNNITAPNSQYLGENISMTNVTLALGYEFHFTKHLLYYAYTGYTVYNRYSIRDNERNEVYSIEDKNTPYVRTGVKFKL